MLRTILDTGFGVNLTQPGPRRRCAGTAPATAMSPASSPNPAAAAFGYRPRGYTNGLKQIVEDHLDELVRVWDERFAPECGPLHPRVKDLLERFVRCGDLHFGFLRLRCANEQFTAKGEKIVPYS